MIYTNLSHVSTTIYLEPSHTLQASRVVLLSRLNKFAQLLRKREAELKVQKALEDLETQFQSLFGDPSPQASTSRVSVKGKAKTTPEEDARETGT